MSAFAIEFLPLFLIVTVSGLVLGMLHYLLIHRHQDLGSEARLPRQLLLLGLTVAAMIISIAVAPFPESTRNQVLALFGIFISGVIAFSSTTFVINFMAAIMLRVTRPFNVGDFITVGTYFGKVAERGIFDTEIQTENRELIAIPNVMFINEAVVVARRSGVVISTSISLGYDIDHKQTEPLMLQAATAAGLSDPYIHVVALGDFSVTYKVHGLLSEVDRILTARSELNRSLLDTLHGAGLEIVSPSITRHITQDASTRIIPEQVAVASGVAKGTAREAEEIVFDKARRSEELEAEKTALQEKSADKTADTGSAERLAAIEEELRKLKEEA